MDKQKVIILNAIMEDVKCKDCPFNDMCETLIENYQQEFCDKISDLLHCDENKGIKGVDK